MKLTRGVSTIYVCALISSCAFIFGCSKAAPLDPLNQVDLASAPTNEVKVNFCTDPAYQQKQYIKTIVILDHSGSNQENYLMAADGSGAPALVNGNIVINPTYATDPTGQTRYGNINTPGTLLNYLYNLPPNNPADPTRFFALIDFNGNEKTYPANAAGFTSNIPAFYNYVQQDATASNGHPNDSGSTDYMGALQQAYNIIENDIQTEKNCAALPLGSTSPGSWCPVPGVATASSYVIVFMSDGSPITSISGVGMNSNGQIVTTGPISITKEPSSNILGEVQTIASLASEKKYVAGVNLFTIYYYHPGNVDLSGQQLLAQMAKVGNGIAYNALSGSNINYAQFQPPTKLIKYKLADIYVTNQSVTWWSDGKLHRDTDGDGLPNSVETAWGSNPLNAYTQGNGVSDYVTYFLTNGAPFTSVDYASGVCSGIKTIPLAGGGYTFVSSDPDGLNDCEKLLLNDAGGIGNPNSNGDGIPDFLAFRNGVPFQIGTNPDVNTPDASGYSIAQKIKFSLPVQVPPAELVNYKPDQYNMQLVSSTATQDCYNLTVTGLPTIGSGNTVRVDVIETNPLLQNSYLYRVGEKKFTSGNPTLIFNDWNNPAEQTAGTWQVWN